jgi:hypothetical protein
MSLLLTFTFAILFLAKKQACGPEARALGGKSIGGKRNPFEDPTVLPQIEAGPIGRPAGRPYIGIPLFLGKEGLARPVQEMMRASWFFRATPLLPGQAMPEIQSILRPLGEK